MKIMALVLFAFISTQAAFAGSDIGPDYDPYSLNCIYDADSKWQVISDIDADLAYFGFTAERLDGSSAGNKETKEFQAVFIYSPGEDSAVDDIAKHFAQRLGIDFSEVFSISEFVERDGNDGLVLKFYMLNGANGSLGAGVYSEVFGSAYKALCE